MKSIPHQLPELLLTGDTFVLLGHSEPDGDCIGSQLALGKYLERKGKKVSLLSPGPFQRLELEEYKKNFHLHIPQDLDKNTAVAVILDCSTLERIGHLAEELGNMKTTVIDHHSSGRSFGDIRYIDPDSPSVTLMVLNLIESMGDTPTQEEAQILLFGLATDTGFFRHLEARRGWVFNAIGRLSDYGASPKEVFRSMYGGRSLLSRQLLGLLLSRTRAACKGRVLFTYETLEDLALYGLENRDSDALYQQLQGVSNCEVVIFIREEEPGLCSVGLRSISAVDVGHIALSFGGGGHALAAGFSWKGSRQEAEKAVMEKVYKTVEELGLAKCLPEGI
jgi:phosphoesterase RecJ-like protein